MNLIGSFLLSVLSVLITYTVWRRWKSSMDSASTSTSCDDDSVDGSSSRLPPVVDDEDAAAVEFKLDVPKGPFSLPIVGNLIQLGYRPHEKMTQWMKDYGPIYQLYLGSQLVVVLNGTETIREALIGQGEVFAGRPKLYMIHATLKGKGLISSPYNHDFNEHKKFLINTINKFGRRRSSLEVNCLQTIRETLDGYRECMDHNFEYTNNQMKNTFSQIASQNVLTMTFGRRMYDETAFSRLMDLITENFQNTAVAAAFNFIPISRIFKRYILKNVMRAHEFLNDLISEKLEEYHDEFDEQELINDGEKESNRRVASTPESNIIESYLRELMNNSSMLLNEHTIKLSSSTSSLYEMQSRKLTERRRSSLAPDNMKEELLKRRKSRYNSFSFDHLSSLVQDLFIAGTETVSLTLNWAIIFAAYYPECQRLIADEIERVLGREKLPTESIRPKLPYVEAFLNETMRYQCAGPILIPRSTIKDTVLKGYHIPSDTFIMVNMWSCMRDEHYWNEPNKFEPRRFIDEKTGLFKCKNEAMMPFSVGKRACIGEPIARLQLFLIFTSLVQKFCFEFANKKDVGNEQLLKGISGIGLSPPNIKLKLTIR